MFKNTLIIIGKMLGWIVLGIFMMSLIIKCSQTAMANVDVIDVIVAIEKVESNQNPYAINKAENAIGSLQIRPIMIADYNRISGEDLPHNVAYNRAMAYIIAQEIFFHYMKGIENPTAKHLAFIWNGGGSAWKRVDNPKNDKKQKNLDLYWEKVKLHL